ncbi:hypothetical protein ACIQTT_10525 [Microbacterium sp. NPDC090225]|uniref:hypothetical protein n=1 Tax=Microbacterium sp. NPDC090225 TaxID=3364207 RepID=UPI003810AEC5
MSSAEIVSALVEQCVELGRATPYKESDTRFATEPFIRWSLLTAALDPDLEEMFTTRNIEMFIQQAKTTYAAGSLGNIRSRLFRIAERIADPHDRRPPVVALPPANPAKPYTPQEVATMMSWANTRATAKRRDSALNLLSLGLGGGLSTNEIGNLRHGDVSVVDGATWLHVPGQRERDVVLVQRWADSLILHPGADPDQFVFRPDRATNWRNVVSNFVNGVPHEVRPQPQRLRATWIVGHLSRGVNVVVLLRAAGVDSLEAFTRYLSFVQEPERDVAVTSLRGSSRP